MDKKGLNKTAFREYDVRGNYPNLVNEEMAYILGRAFATKLKALNKCECVVGHDNRLSSDSLTKSLLKGITESGVKVKYLGLISTPMYYFACLYLKIDSGIMVTASHNPKEDNGFKIALENYDNACGDKIKELYEICQSGNFTKGMGIIEPVNIKEEYVNEVLKNIHLKKKLKVVVDPANATTSIVIRDIFDKINADVVYINEVSDGNFPSHHPDPSIMENMIQLQNKVLEENADLGIALDGDGDRVGLVDELGNVIPVDTFMAIIWNDLMPNAENKTALFDVKCSKTLIDEIIRLGGIPYMYRTGNSYQKNKIKEMDLIFGGELSGHVFFRDKWQGFDDGIYAGLRMLEILSKTGKKASETYAHMNKYFSTPEIKVAVTEETKFLIVEKIKEYAKTKGYEVNDIDGARINVSGGWALVRASNTGPNLTLRFEAETEERLEEIKKEFKNQIDLYKVA